MCEVSVSCLRDMSLSFEKRKIDKRWSMSY